MPDTACPWKSARLRRKRNDLALKTLISICALQNCIRSVPDEADQEDQVTQGACPLHRVLLWNAALHDIDIDACRVSAAAPDRPRLRCNGLRPPNEKQNRQMQRKRSRGPQMSVIRIILYLYIYGGRGRNLYVNC